MSTLPYTIRGTERFRHQPIDLDVFVYVKDVLDTLLDGCRDYAALRPDVWKLAHPEAVRIYRQDERRHRAEVKSAKRARRRGGRR